MLKMETSKICVLIETMRFVCTMIIASTKRSEIIKIEDYCRHTCTHTHIQTHVYGHKGKQTWIQVHTVRHTSEKGSEKQTKLINKAKSYINFDRSMHSGTWNSFVVDRHRIRLPPLPSSPPSVTVDTRYTRYTQIRWISKQPTMTVQTKKYIERNASSE